MRIDLYESDTTDKPEGMEFRRYADEAPDGLDYYEAVKWFKEHDRNHHKDIKYTVIIIRRE